MGVFKAYLDNYQEIIVTLSNEFYNGDSNKFYLKNENRMLKELVIIEVVQCKGYKQYHLSLDISLTLGSRYTIIEEHGNRTHLEYRNVVLTKEFDDQYYYDKNDLGAIYSEEKTSFALWSPIAFQVLVGVEINDDVIIKKMIKGKDGVFRFDLYGNYDGCKYYYLVDVNNQINECVDPYSLSLSTNGKRSVIIDKNKIKRSEYKSCLPVYKNYVDTILYELSIRDISMDSKADFISKGKFLALTYDKMAYYGNKIGLDYLVDLGITHVQIMPVHDFFTVDEINSELLYNWGYDPNHFMALEGSYSMNPNDGYSRMKEFKALVNKFHERGIRVNLDLVYNHVYDQGKNCLELVVPKYYFRVDSNGSFCGNDYESTRRMARKYLLDCCRNWVDTYEVDGFRFDLMGIIDLETINEIYKYGKSVDESFMVYGEGWNMPTNLDDGEKASYHNHVEMPNIAFFSDRFRDVTKGKDEIASLGYLSNDLNLIGYFQNVLMSGASEIKEHCFTFNPNQVINYVECHDNYTLYDKLSLSLQDDEIVKGKRINLINSAVILACGIPFIGMGQEFKRTKYNEGNSYRSNDNVNMINYDLVHKNQKMINYLKDLIMIRKEYDAFHLSSNEEILSHVKFSHVNNGLVYKIVMDNYYLDIIFNPTYQDITYKYDEMVNVIFDENGRQQNVTKEFVVKGLSIVIVKGE
ncbi:MAG: type I pullulanase [Erysipelotrichaceae bacterium]